MDWKKNTIEEIKNYSYLRIKCVRLREKLEELESKSKTIHGVKLSHQKIKSSAQSQKILNQLIEREELYHMLNATRNKVKKLERAFKKLDPNERSILDKFYISRQDLTLAQMCSHFSVERSTLYRMKDSALKKLALNLFGEIN